MEDLDASCCLCSAHDRQEQHFVRFSSVELFLDFLPRQAAALPGKETIVIELVLSLAQKDTSDFLLVCVFSCFLHVTAFCQIDLPPNSGCLGPDFATISENKEIVAFSAIPDMSG